MRSAKCSAVPRPMEHLWIGMLVRVGYTCNKYRSTIPKRCLTARSKLVCGFQMQQWRGEVSGEGGMGGGHTHPGSRCSICCNGVIVCSQTCMNAMNINKLISKGLLWLCLWVSLCQGCFRNVAVSHLTHQLDLRSARSPALSEGEGGLC